MQVDPIKDLSEQASSVVELMGKSGDDMDIPLQVWVNANNIQSKYAKVFTSYADVHTAINGGGNMSDAEIKKTGDEYLSIPYDIIIFRILYFNKFFSFTHLIILAQLLNV